jgi:hypothetical protein
MSNNKKNPTPIDAEVQARATADLEATISQELSIEDEEEKSTKAAERLFSGGTPITGGPPHTILGVPMANKTGGPKPDENSQ